MADAHSSLSIAKHNTPLIQALYCKANIIMTESEKLLEIILKTNCIEFSKIPEREIRTPDYEVRIDDQLSYWEVKELSENDDEKDIIKTSETGKAQSYCIYSDRVENSIKSASKQFKGYRVTNCPCVIVIYDARDFATKDFLLHQKLQSVMLGVADIMQKPDGNWIEVNRKPGLLTNRMKYVSAIVLASKPSNDLWFYHNPNATISLTNSLTLSFFAKQFKAVKTNKGLEWVAI